MQFLMTIIIVPKSLNSARTYIKSSDVNVLSSIVRERKFIDSVKNLTIFVEEKSTNGLMKNIFLKEKIGKNKSQIIYSKKGKFDDNDKDLLILFDGEVLNQNTGSISNFSFKETEINLNRFSTQKITHFKIQENSSNNLMQCFLNLIKYKNLITDIIRKENNLKENCRWDNLERINQELIKRFILPFYLPILSLIACLLITKSKDEFKFNKFTYLLFMLGVVIIIISELSIKYASENYLNNFFLISLPILMFLIIYSYFIFKTKIPKKT
jgi:Predicted permeases